MYDIPALKTGQDYPGLRLNGTKSRVVRIWCFFAALQAMLDNAAAQCAAMPCTAGYPAVHSAAYGSRK
jgi:hypothetical protein